MADDVHGRLTAVSEDLADRAMDLLRAALRTRDDEERVRLKVEEKRVTRARRSVDKAIALLAETNDADANED